MNDDIQRLIERTGRTMRPEFRAQLLDLLEEPGSVEARPATRFDDDDAFLFVESDERPQPRRLAVGVWLSVAAALAVVVVLVVAPRAIDQPGSPSEPGPGTTVTPARCALDAETLSVVASAVVDIRVGIMPDGLLFCLVDDATGAPLVAQVPVNLVSADASPPSQPVIIEQGVAATTAYYYVIAVPDGMPVASIRSADGQLHSFPTRVGRYFLVLDTSYDLRDSDTFVPRNLNLSSSSGSVLATLVGDPRGPDGEGGS